MKIANFFFIFWVLTLLTACEAPNEKTVDSDKATYYLCRIKWDSFFIDNLGIECEQEFLFEKNGNGTETFTSYKPYNTETKQYPFSWYWTSGYFNSICIEYSPTDRIFFDRVEVGYEFLRGYLDGVEVEFHPYTLP